MMPLAVLPLLTVHGLACDCHCCLVVVVFNLYYASLNDSFCSSVQRSEPWYIY